MISTWSIDVDPPGPFRPPHSETPGWGLAVQDSAQILVTGQPGDELAGTSVTRPATHGVHDGRGTVREWEQVQQHLGGALVGAGATGQSGKQVLPLACRRGAGMDEGCQRVDGLRTGRGRRRRSATPQRLVEDLRGPQGVPLPLQHVYDRVRHAAGSAGRSHSWPAGGGPSNGHPYKRGNRPCPRATIAGFRRASALPGRGGAPRCEREAPEDRYV